jgi:hypothetical protein
LYTSASGHDFFSLLNGYQGTCTKVTSPSTRPKLNVETTHDAASSRRRVMLYLKSALAGIVMAVFGAPLFVYGYLGFILRDRGEGLFGVSGGTYEFVFLLLVFFALGAGLTYSRLQKNERHDAGVRVLRSPR